MKYLGVVVFCMIEIIIISSQTFSQSNPVPVATFEREENDGASFGEYMDYGDVNGDGINDLMVSGCYIDNQYGMNAGRVYVFFGCSFSGNISASTADIMIDGIHENHFAALIQCGNIDGDGYADLVLGTPCYTDTVNGYYKGRVYIFYGKNLIMRKYFTLHDADQFFYGDTTMREINVATVFDFDGDGLDDVFINTYARNYGGGIYEGQNRLNVFYAKNILNDDSIDVRNPDLYFYGYDPFHIMNSLIGLTKGFRFADLNKDTIKDLAVSYAKEQDLYHHDTVAIFFGQQGGRYGSYNYNKGDFLIPSSYDYGGYNQTTLPYLNEFNGSYFSNLILCNSFFHLDPEYNNQYGRIYLFGDSLKNGMTLRDAQTHITGTIAGIWCGNFGMTFSSGDMNGDDKDDFAVGSYGWGYVGHQYVFKGSGQFPDSMVDNDADVKIIGNSQFSELHNGSMFADVMGEGRPQLLVCYSRNGSRVNGFVNLYSSSMLVSVDDPANDKPSKVELYPNYPNPFNPSTTIKYYLPKNEKVELKIFNILGQEVKTLVHSIQKNGEQKITWNGTNDRGQTVSSGVYVYRLKAGSSVLTKKMILLR